ncbi:hypothetical protein P22_0294 [Propionispora sp. 2/2-37]|uniref:phosphodiesterase n=1 Tax=Propionispora sp. 2/2-37 TaxID=1677858 RepID=UPI0006BB7C43|nr:phosphodiesterase [Propionispora sp. 2/2-37]CUH94228.1 hypothetical protein P22_0294 [Propionispora sp. 2/2-37]
MKIGVISDTHGCSATWEKIYDQYLYDADFIIHAGDVLYHGPRNPVLPEYNPSRLAEALNACPVPFIVAAGNCDSEVDSMVLDIPVQSPYSYAIVNDLRILVTHGQNQTEEKLFALAQQVKADLIITGHTHIAALKQQNGVTHLNPGSPVSGLSKQVDQHGTLAIVTNRKISVIDIDAGKIIMEESI